MAPPTRKQQPQQTFQQYPGNQNLQQYPGLQQWPGAQQYYQQYPYQNPYVQQQQYVPSQQVAKLDRPRKQVLDSDDEMPELTDIMDNIDITCGPASQDTLLKDDATNLDFKLDRGSVDVLPGEAAEEPQSGRAEASIPAEVTSAKPPTKTAGAKMGTASKKTTLAGRSLATKEGTAPKGKSGTEEIAGAATRTKTAIEKVAQTARASVAGKASVSKKAQSVAKKSKTAGARVSKKKKVNAKQRESVKMPGADGALPKSVQSRRITAPQRSPKKPNDQAATAEQKRGKGTSPRKPRASRPTKSLSTAFTDTDALPRPIRRRDATITPPSTETDSDKPSTKAPSTKPQRKKKQPSPKKAVKKALAPRGPSRAATKKDEAPKTKEVDPVKRRSINPPPEAPKKKRCCVVL